MALAALGPSRGHTGFGFLPVAAIPGAVQGAQSVIHAVEGIFGGSRFASSTYEGAEASRANSYLLGIAAGSVQAGQLLYGQLNSDSSKYAQQYVVQIVSQAESNYPSVMSQAKSAGLLHDQADGSQGLQILLQLGIPYQDQYAGYSTNTGDPPSDNTATLVQRLATLTPGTTTIPGTSIQVPTAVKSAAMPLLIGGGLLVAILLSSKRAS